MNIQGDLNQRGGTNLVSEFVVKIVSLETEKAYILCWQTGWSRLAWEKSKDSWGEINKNITPQGFEGDEYNELREKLEGMSGIIKAIRK